VAKMLREVQREAVTRDLHVGRRVVVEVVLPLEREAEEVQVEFFRFGDVENAHQWNDSLKCGWHAGSAPTCGNDAGCRHFCWWRVRCRDAGADGEMRRAGSPAVAIQELVLCGDGSA